MAGRSSSVHDDYGRSSLSPGPPPLPGKRKFEDPGEAPRRATGFSDSAKDYRSVPPMSEFELAKQKAEQIAARLVGQEFKKSRTNDEHESASGNNNVDRGHSHSYGSDDRHDFYQPPSIRRMDVPNAKVGLVIGKGGETIRNLQQQSGAKIQVTRDNEVDPSSNARQVELSGTAEQISRAEQLIREVIGDVTGGGGGGGPALGGGGAGEPLQIRVPNNKVGLVIGKGGETIKSLQAMSGARIQVQHDRETEPGAQERVVTLTGTKEQTDMAQELIKDVIGEGRRGYAAGGYQQNYRGGPQQWGQSGYGYQQNYGNQQYGGYWEGQQGQQGSYDYYQNQPAEGTQQTNSEGYNYPQGYYGYDQQYAGYEQAGYEQAGYEQAGYEQAAGYEQGAAAGYEQGAYNQAQPAYNQQESEYAGAGYYDYEQHGYQYPEGANAAAAAAGGDAEAAGRATKTEEDNNNNSNKNKKHS